MNSQTVASKTQSRGIIMLLLTAFIWGTSFVAQSVGMEVIDAFTFNGMRSLLALFVILPTLWIKRRFFPPPAVSSLPFRQKLRHGFVLGLVFFAATSLQQFAFYDSSAGKIALLTTLYLFFVPIFGLFSGKRIPRLMWPCIVIGFIGLYLLSIRPGEGAGIGFGDLLAVLSAVAFATQILMVEKLVKEVDGVELSCMQFVVACVLSLVCMFLFEAPSFSAIRAAAVPLLYAGILSSGLAYTFQIIGQKYTEATLASLLMCMESLFAVIASALVLHERMSKRELAGCVLLMGAVFAASLLNARAQAQKVPDNAYNTLDKKS